MGNRLDASLQLEGLGIPEGRIGLDTLTAVGTGGAATSDSAYTQAGAGPGQGVSDDPESKLTVEVSNGQEVPFAVQVRNAGLPGLGRAGLPLGTTTDVGILWREQSSATEDDWRGKQGTASLDLWAAAEWSDVSVFANFELLVNPKTQQIICLAAPGSSSPITGRLFDWNARAWHTSKNNISLDPTEVLGEVRDVWDAITGVVLPSGRALAIGVTSVGEIQVFASDNLVLWGPYADSAGSVSSTSTDATAAFYRSDVVLFSEDVDDVEQLVSNDLGTNFILVAPTFTSFGRDLQARALPNNGGIVVAYRRSSDNRPAVRILSSASQALTDAAEILVDDVSGSEPVTELGCAVDDNGVIVVLGRPNGTGSRTADEVVVWSSFDGGATFDGPFPLHRSNDVATCPTNLRARFCRGWLVCAHNWVASPGNEDGSIGTMWSAGWSNLNVLPGTQTWIPLDLPADIGNWVNGGATAPTLESPGVMEFAIVASTGVVDLDPTAQGGGGGQGVYFETRIDSGTPAVTSFENGVDLRDADGASDFRIEVRIGAGGTRLVDGTSGGAIGSDIVVDGTLWRSWLVTINSLGSAFVFYRESWETKWVAALIDFALTDGGATGETTGRIRAGSGSATTVTSHWRRLDEGASQFGIGLRPGTLGFANSAISTGAALSNLPNAVHELGGADPDTADFLAGTATPPLATYLSAVRGPGRRGEVLTITPFFERGVSNAFPVLSSSPSSPFETLDTTELRLVFDFGVDTRIGHIWHWYLGLFGGNFKTAVLEGSTNGIAWTVLGTYNGAEGFEGLTYARVGDTIRPAAGTVASGRYLKRNELAPHGTIADRAGYAVLDLGGTPTARPIVGNGPGVWADPSTPSTVFAEVRIAGDVGSVAASGTCDLVFPDAVLLAGVSGIFPATSQFYRFVRVRVPASQVIVGAGYRIGAMSGPGTVGVFGKRSSRGWIQSMTPNTRTSRSRFGVRRRRQLGPNTRRWSQSWADGTLLSKIHGAASPDYLAGGASTAALAAIDDVWWTLWGLEEETNGWAVPIVGLNSIPNVAAVTLNDRTRFLYGHVDTGAIQFNEALGDVGINAFGRIDSMAIDGTP